MIHSLKISAFRNIRSADLRFDSPLVVFDGVNGAGKTSHLESIFALSSGRSFRSPRHSHVVMSGEQGYTLFAKGDFGQVGLYRSAGGVGDKAQLNGRTVASASELSAALPVMLINADSFRLLEGGPDARRQFFDWGVFHVEHGVASLYRDYRKALKQRNALLRQGRNAVLEQQERAVRAVLIEKGQALTDARSRYFDKLVSCINPLVEMSVNTTLIPRCIFKARNGWSKQFGCFSDALAASEERDWAQGVTSVGPHKFDVAITVEGGGIAKDWLSRGQTKRLAIMLKLAQLATLRSSDSAQHDKRAARVVVLADDLPAELDGDQLSWAVASLQDASSQLFITTVDASSVVECLQDPAHEAQVFHVEHE